MRGVNSKLVIISVSVVTIVAFFALLGWGLIVKSPVTEQSGVLRIGRSAPDLTLSLFDGEHITLAEYKGRPVVINFWASWCVPCREEAPMLEKTWRRYRDQGVMFIGVDIQDTEDKALAFVREFNKTYPTGMDRDGRITLDYGVIGIPVTFFVNRDGLVVRRFVGSLREEQLVKWIDELL